MRRDEVLDSVRAIAPELKELGFERLYLFGSVARDEPAAADVDLLYEAMPLNRPGFRQLTDALDRLEQLLGRRVDLVERERLHRRIRPRIEAEMIEIYR